MPDADTTSPVGGSADTSEPTAEGNSNKTVCTVWHGYDVVLTDNCHPSETRRASPSKEDDAPSQASPRSLRKNDHPLGRSWRRRGSGRADDYGWLRKLDLRSDVPPIDEIRDWSFDVLQFEDTVLVSAFVKMLEYYDLLEKFQLDRETLERYGMEVMRMHHKDCYYQEVDIEKEGATGEDEGKKEPRPDILCEYHNWYHAVSCAHVCFLFLTLGGADKFLYPVEIFSIIMGALIHDLDHPGTNNDFEIKRSTSLAELYGNDSVLERHSINMGLNMCLKKPELDWLGSFRDEKDREYVKHFIGESVLATDPARHGDVVKEALAFAERGPPHFNQDDPQHRLFIGRLLLHSADIANPLHSSFEVASDWAIRVTTEFSRQAAKEKQLQLPVTTFMDGLDSQVKIAKLQIGFFQWMVKPLYNTIGILFPDLKMMEDWGERNCAEYQTVIDAHEIGDSIDTLLNDDAVKDELGEGKYANTDGDAPY